MNSLSSLYEQWKRSQKKLDSDISAEQKDKICEAHIEYKRGIILMSLLGGAESLQMHIYFIFYLPNLLSLFLKSSMTLKNSSLENSGQHSSTKASSEYADCHKRKLLILLSPPVLMTRSG